MLGPCCTVPVHRTPNHPLQARCFTPNVEETYTIPLKAELMREGPWSNQLPFTLYDADRPPHVKNFSKHWGSIDGGEITDLYGDDFAPTEFLRTRFGNEGSSIVNYGPATFVTVYHIRVEIPRYHEPATVEVRTHPTDLLDKPKSGGPTRPRRPRTALHSPASGVRLFSAGPPRSSVLLRALPGLCYQRWEGVRIGARLVRSQAGDVYILRPSPSTECFVHGAQVRAPCGGHRRHD